jgi:hypothetical protein
MSEQRIPRADGDFSAYANHYYEAVEKFWSVQGLDETDLKPLKDALSAWNAAYRKHIAAQNAARAARETKDAAKRELERQIRPVSAFVQSWSGTTDADRAAIGISVRATGGTPVPPPTSRPVVLVESGSRLTHRLRIADLGDAHEGPLATPRGKRPKGTLGAEVYVALINANEPVPGPPAFGAGAAAPSAEDRGGYRFLRTVTGGSAEVSFQPPQGGKQAAYLVRWISATGEPGPWGETILATIAA